MYKTGQANAAVDAIGSALAFMASSTPAAAVARSQCAAFKTPTGSPSFAGTTGVIDLAAALGVSSPELAQEIASAGTIGSAGDLNAEALKTWAAALDARLTPVVYLLGNKLSAVDVAVAVQIKLRLFPSGAADKALAALVTPAHVRFFNNIYAIVGRGSGVSAFASELKHPGGIKATAPVWPDVSPSAPAAAPAAAPKVEQPKHAAAAAASATAAASTPAASAPAPAPPSGEKKEKAAKADKPKEPEPVKSKGNDASSLDIRVGVVCTCTNHPEADKLYARASLLQCFSVTICACTCSLLTQATPSLVLYCLVFAVY
jgi:glutathione S-transferase